MAYLLNFIGQFQMQRIEGEVIAPRLEGMLSARPGVDDFGVVRTGRRGRPFELLTMVDAPTIAFARFWQMDYQNAVLGDPVELVIESFEYLQLGIKFVILDVGDFQVTPHAGALGYLVNSPQGAAGAILRARWQLAAFLVE